MRYAFTFASIIMACSLTLTSAWAGWGCGYRFSGLEKGRYGAVWAYVSRAKAHAAALKLCRSSGAHRCFVVGCREGIDTEAQAHVPWPLKGPAGVCVGSGCK
ncbi:MAG TPA: hypothetical protein VKX28_33345 [Xanthobacteraceae bacterium]|jgi:hypothetical protein|nr:hypothetical protein [Xanthobacteraceae bacterium]